MEQRVHCPEIGVLEKYLAGGLDGRSVAEFQEHLEICGLCGELLDRLKEFERVAAELESEPDWTQAEARLEQACQQCSPQIGTAARLRKYAWVPAAATILVVVATYSVWRRRSPPVPLPTPPPAVLQARAVTGSAAVVLDLNTVRDQQSLPAIEARAGQETAVLLFFVPVAPEVRLTAVIRDEVGAQVVDLGPIASYDRSGNFCVVVALQHLRPGRYQLVTHPNGKAGASAKTLSFPFSRQ